MVFVQPNDKFISKLNTLMADYDRDTIVNLYQPLVGFSAISLYFTLWSEANNKKSSLIDNHESLLCKMRMNTGEFIKARKSLEAIGLLVTYLKDESDGKTFIYNLYAPKNPKEFFDDTLLYGLLIKYLGESDVKKLKALYQIDNFIIEGSDISASFNDIFHPDLNDPCFIKAIEAGNNVGRNYAKISNDFTYESLINEISKISNIDEKCLSKKELKEITRLSTLYGINVEESARYVIESYNDSNEKGKRVDFDLLTKRYQNDTKVSYLSSNKNKACSNKISSDTALASKINLMDSLSPKDFLTILQNGILPAIPDLKLIDMLSKKFKLTNSVINALVDYVLTINKNVLSRPYCEKIAACLAREGIKSTIDAMNYLKMIQNGKNNKTNVKLKTNKDNHVDTSSGSADRSWDELMLILNEGEETNGEA